MRVLQFSVCPTAGLFLRGFVCLQTSVSRDRWIQRVLSPLWFHEKHFSLLSLSPASQAASLLLHHCSAQTEGVWVIYVVSGGKSEKKKNELNIASFFFFLKGGTRNSYVIRLLLSSKQDLSAWCICSHLKQLQVTFRDRNYPAPATEISFPSETKKPLQEHIWIWLEALQLGVMIGRQSLLILKAAAKRLKQQGEQCCRKMI